MDDYPKKLAQYLDTLPAAERSAREQLYRTTLAQAMGHGLQSPRFWAARQIIAGLNAGQIQHKILKRIRRVPKVPAEAGPVTPIRELRPTRVPRRRSVQPQ